MRIRRREIRVRQFHRFNGRVASRLLGPGTSVSDSVCMSGHGSSPWLRGRDAQVRDVLTLFIAFILEVKNTRTAELLEYETARNACSSSATIPRGEPPAA